MLPVRVLLLGAGGREHALACKFSESPRLQQLFAMPGNPGIAEVAQCIPGNPLDFDHVAAQIRTLQIDYLLVGPEKPLAEGIVNYLEAQDLPTLKGIIGPRKEGATLESSKIFSKRFMQEFGIPTADARFFDESELNAALDFARLRGGRIVVKADGLTGGKGVVVADNIEEAEAAITNMLTDRTLGEAGDRILLEEVLEGQECSCFVLVGGNTFTLMPMAKDYKRAGDGETGPNTGGMGSISPVPFADVAFEERVLERIVRPTLAGLKQRGITYRGVLFIGLMVEDGEPKAIEYNVRMGDPETQSVLLRLDGDIVDLMEACAQDRLNNGRATVLPHTVCTVVVCAGGYPGHFMRGIPIGMPAKLMPGCHIFHAGTALNATGGLSSAGGRVLNVSATAPTLAQARQLAYEQLAQIQYKDRYYRFDIGMDVL